MGDTSLFASKLKRLRTRQVVSHTPTAIMGTIADLASNLGSKPWFRIGMWPCQSTDDRLAMGIWSVLASLLERWSDITIYRLFVELQDDVDWDNLSFNFGAKDWALDDLDDNVAIHGRLEITGTNDYTLTIEVENDQAEQGNGEKTFVQQASGLADLLSKLPELANEIARWLQASLLNHSDPVYSVDQDDVSIKRALDLQLSWNLRLIQYLWDDESIEDYEIAQEFKKGHHIAESGGFSAWILGKMAATVLVPGLSVIADLLLENIYAIMADSRHKAIFGAVVGEPLFKMGHVQDTYDLLEEILESNKDGDCSFVLGHLYAQGGRIGEGIEVFQDAIQAGVQNPWLLKEYGNLLMLAAQYETVVAAACFVNTDQFEQREFIIHESIEAFDHSIQLNPQDLETRFLQILQIVSVDDIDEDRLWECFEQLVQVDVSGDYLRDVIDAFYDLDISEGIRIVESEIKQAGHQRHLYLALGLLHIVDDSTEEAIPYLEKAKDLSSGHEQLSDIEQLLLIAEDPDFEQHYAELIAVIDAGNSPSADDMDFLDYVVEQAPHLVEGIVALAKAYSLWGDTDAALEVLLDGNERVPGQATILDILAKVLWDTDQRDLALQYLNQGLENSPNHVGLLVRTGQYLFDAGNVADARIYLARAEELDPRNGRLASVRAHIARRIAEDPSILE